VHTIHLKWVCANWDGRERLCLTTFPDVSTRAATPDAFSTAFSIDPKEQTIMIFMTQMHPNGDLKLDRQVKVVAYQAIID
jgi:hypothetical protein